MRKNKLVSPVVKWVGGKRQLMETYKELFPERTTPYCEPFMGGGAVLFNLQPNIALVNDINRELIEMYEVVRDDVDELIDTLKYQPNREEHFYRVRNLDRYKETYEQLSKVDRAARLIYLNKTCFNGLFRVNNAGEFNSPFGFYANPNIVNEPCLRAVNKYFNKAKITFGHSDFEEVLENVKKGTFVYLDPPYDPVSTTSNFTGYSRGGFTREDQIRLKNCCDFMDRKGINFMLSNSATEFIRQLYGSEDKYNITIVQANRNVNSCGNRRGHVDEVVIRNYG